MEKLIKPNTLYYCKFGGYNYLYYSTEFNSTEFNSGFTIFNLKKKILITFKKDWEFIKKSTDIREANIEEKLLYQKHFPGIKFFSLKFFI